MKKRKLKFSIFNTIVCSVLILYSLCMLYLLFWGFITAFKTVDDFQFNSVLALPEKWQFEHIKIVWSYFVYAVDTEKVIGGKVDIVGMLMNTLLYAGGGALLMTIAPCMVAYAATKYNYVYSNILNGIVIVTMILPIIGAGPSMLAFLRSIHLYDTMLGVWLQKFNFLGLYFLTFSATFKAIPKDFSEAASIDGASEMRIFVSIIIPLVKNIFFTVMLIHFVEIWNDYQVSLLYIPSYPTLAMGVQQITSHNVALGPNGEYPFNEPPLRLMTSMFLIIPILVLFIIFRNKLMGNLSMGGVKE